MTGGRQATGNEAPTTDIERPDYETAIREAIDGNRQGLLLTSSPEVRAMVAVLAAKAVLPLVAAEVERAYAQGRQDFAEYLSRLADKLYANADGRRD